MGACASWADGQCKDLPLATHKPSAPPTHRLSGCTLWLQCTVLSVQVHYHRTQPSVSGHGADRSPVKARAARTAAAAQSQWHTSAKPQRTSVFIDILYSI